MWFPLKVRSHFSLQTGLSKAPQIVSRIDQLEYAGCALTDIGNLAGCPVFLKTMNAKKTRNKKDRTPKKAILGSQFFICEQPTIKNAAELFSVYILAKNANGWKNLIKASSESYKPDFFYKKPRLSIEQLASFSQGDFVCYSGSIGTELANCIFTDSKVAYKLKTEEDVKKVVHVDWTERLATLVTKYELLFGKGNFFLEVELIDPTPAATLVAKAMRWAGKKVGVACIAVANSFYSTKADASDQRVLLCSGSETTMREMQERLDTTEFATSRFFSSNNYHIPTLDEMKALHTEEELENTVKIAASCEEYSLGDRPRFPRFECPDGLSEDAYLKRLGGEGWNKKIKGKFDSEVKVYAARMKKELDVFFEANLSSYFLIVQDYVRWAIRNGIRTGFGRGSAAGCLTSYLLDIIKVNPLQYDLLFERFYSAARNSPAHVSFDESPF